MLSLRVMEVRSETSEENNVKTSRTLYSRILPVAPHFTPQFISSFLPVSAPLSRTSMLPLFYQQQSSLELLPPSCFMIIKQFYRLAKALRPLDDYFRGPASRQSAAPLSAPVLTSFDKFLDLKIQFNYDTH